MQIPKRRQILQILEMAPRHSARSPNIIEYLVLVTGVGHPTRARKKSCRVLCLARNIIVREQNIWVWAKKPDDEWTIRLYGNKVELVSKTDLPLYINWEHGSAFGRMLKGEL